MCWTFFRSVRTSTKTPQKADEHPKSQIDSVPGYFCSVAKKGIVNSTSYRLEERPSRAEPFLLSTNQDSGVVGGLYYVPELVV